MPNAEANTTPPATSGDTTNAPQENWEQRYLGLQKVLAKRDADLNTRQAELDALRAEHEAATARLNDYAQRDVDASEEEQARQQYESLKARFEGEPPRPVGNNAARGNAGSGDDWLSGSPSGGYQTRERTGTGTGWPT